MKDRWNRLSAPVRYGLVTLAVGMGLILFWRLLSGLDDLWVSFRRVMGTVGRVCLPFVLAFFISYALSAPVNGLEKLLQRMTKNRFGSMRIPAMVLVYLSALLVVVWLVTDIVPALVSDLIDFASWAPNYLQQVRNYYNNEILTQSYMDNTLMQELMGGIYTQLDALGGSIGSSAADRLMGWLTGIPQLLVTLGLSLVLSIYLLIGTRRIFSGITRFAIRRLGKSHSRRIFRVTGQLDRVFGRYISAKLLESLILFVICEIVFLIIPVRYTSLMSLIIAVTHLVPYLGPLTGSVIVILLALLDTPALALWTAGAVIVIQCLDAWVIAPRIIGDRQGLHPFWVLAVVLIGGQLAGIPGMLLAVPVGAVVKILLTKTRKPKEEHNP